MQGIRAALRGILWGSFAGALILGIGARLVMRLLALYRDIPPGFSTGGSLEVVAYAAIVGSVTGLLFAVAMTRLSMPIRYSGTLVAIFSYAGTIVTLPRHIAATVQPFAGDMAIVLSLFGVCFLIFGYVLALVLARRRRNVQH